MFSYLKMESWQKAVENCNYALEIDPDSVKGLFRRATGFTKVKVRHVAGS